MDEFEVKVFRNLSDVAPAFDFWDHGASHVLSLRNVFCELIRTRSDIFAPHIIAVRQTGQLHLLALFRLEEREIRLRFGYWTCWRQKCVSLTMGCGGLVGQPTPQVLEVLLRHVLDILRGGSVDMVYLDGVSIGSELHTVSNSIFPRMMRQFIAVRTPHWVVDLPATGEQFVASLNKRQRSTIRSKNKLLLTDFGSRARYFCSNGAEGATALAVLLEKVASKTYHRQLGVGFIADEEHVRRLEALIQKGCLRCYILEVSGEPLAFYVGALVQKTFFPSYTAYDPDFQRYDPGTILFSYMVTELCKEGTKVFDFGGGDAFYKRRLCTRHWDERVYLMFNPTLKGVWLNLLSSINNAITLIGRRMERNGNWVQRLKTLWRQHLSGADKHSNTQAGNPEEI